MKDRFKDLNDAQKAFAKEEYRDVIGFEGSYKVSNLGNVKSLDRVVTTVYGFSKRLGCVLTPEITRDGYCRVCLQNNGKRLRKTVHQLVSIMFLNHVIDGHNTVVDHIDNDKQNNNVDNLQLISNRENSAKDRKGTSRYTGVSYAKRYKNKWAAQIGLNNKHIHLGHFKEEYTASIAYQTALHNHLRNGYK